MSSHVALPVPELGEQFGDVNSPNQLQSILGLSRRTIDSWIRADRLEGCYRRRGRRLLLLRQRVLERIFNGDDWSDHRTPERLPVGERVTIYPRGKRGVYQADFHYDGEHCRRSLKTADQNVATDRALELERQIQDRTLASIGATRRLRSPKQMTLSDALDAFIDFKKSADARPKTIGKYSGTLRGFVAFAAGRGVFRVRQATLPLIDAYRAMRPEATFRGKRIRPKQMYHDASLLKQFFKW